MAETGSAGGMAAAALVGLKGGTLLQAIGAASLLYKIHWVLFVIPLVIGWKLPALEEMLWLLPMR